MSIFECKALTKNYGVKTVLDSIDLTIEPVRSQSCSFRVCTWAREDHVSSATFRAAQVYQELNPILHGSPDSG